MRIYILIILMLFFKTTFSQNTIRTLDGKLITINKLDTIDNVFIFYENEKGKHRSINKNDVFSIQLYNQKEQIFYIPDSLNDSFTISQMRNYLKGEYDADKNYKRRRSFWGGLSVGLISPIALPAIGISSVLSPILPVGYVATIGATNKKEKHFDLVNDQFKNQYYKQGYLEKARKKRLTNSMLGAGLGLIIGSASAFFIYEFNK